MKSFLMSMVWGLVTGFVVVAVGFGSLPLIAASIATVVVAGRIL